MLLCIKNSISPIILISLVFQEYRFSSTAFPIIFRITLHGDKPGMKDIQHTFTKNMNQDLSWGLINFITEDDMLERVRTFHATITEKDAEASKSADVMVVPPSSSSQGEASAASVYRLKGNLVIRFVSATAWTQSSTDMLKSPSKYLFLDATSSRPTTPQVQPSHPTRSLEESMLTLLKDAQTDGDVSFLVGDDPGCRFRAHKNIVGMASPVKLFHENMKEGGKEVRIKDMSPAAFKPLLTFMYTRTIADKDIHAYAEELLAAAEQYQIPLLHNKCEVYLCWKVQVGVVVFFPQLVAASF